MSKLGLVTAREFQERTRKKSFWVMTFLTPILMLALMTIPALIALWGGDGGTREIVVVDKTQGGQVFKGLVSGEEIVFRSSEGIDYPAAAEVYKDAYGILVIPESILSDNTQPLRFYTAETSTIDLETNLRSSVESVVEKIRIENSGIEGLEETMAKIEADLSINSYELSQNSDGETEAKESSAIVYMVISYLTAFIIYMFVLLYGSQVLQGIVDEKQNRILELVVSSVRPFDLMMGKVLGIAAVAFLQLVVWIAFIVAGVLIFGSLVTPDIPVDTAMATGAASVDSTMSGVLSSLTDISMAVRVIGTFILMFVGGYLLYASLFAAIGSAVDNIQDTQQLQMPVTVPLIIALFVMLAVMQEPNSQLAVWCSIIPFTSPIVMMARISYGVPVWEWVACVVCLYGTFALTTWLAGKIYRVGIFMHGKKPTLKDLIRWARYK